MAPVIKLQSSDSKEFNVEIGVIALSKTLDTMIKDLGLGDEETSMAIPLPNVDGATLAIVLKWCSKHKNDKIREPPKTESKEGCVVPKWDKEFLSNFDKEVLLDILMAANYLNIAGLLDYSCQLIADMLHGKHPELIRKEFGIENDFTEEENNRIKVENAWCLDFN